MMTGFLAWVAALSVCVVLLMGLERVATAAIDDARAATAADAAALAGVVAGEPAARAAAARNDATVESFSISGDVVTVYVRVGSAHGEASAERFLVPADE